MRKKFFGILLLGAGFLIASGLVSSCKDYEAEDIADLNTQVDNLQDLLKQETQELKDTKEELEKEIEDNQKDINALEDSIADHLKLIQELQDKLAKCRCNERFDSLNNVINNDLRVTINNLQTAIDNLETTVANHTQQIAALESKVSTLESAVNTINNTLIQYEQRITDLENKFNDLEPRVTQNEEDIDSLFKLYNAINDSVTVVKAKAEAAYTLAEQAKTAADNAQKTADAAQTAADNAKAAADAAQTTADNAQKAADNAQKTADDAQKAADDAQKDATQALTDAKAAKDAADAAQKDATQALADAKTAKDAADAAQTAADKAQQTADAAKELAEQNQKDIEELKDVVEDLQDQIDVIDSQISQLQQDVASAQAKAEAAYSIANANSKLIDALEEKVNKNAEGIADNKEKIDDILNNIIPAIWSNFDNYVTVTTFNEFKDSINAEVANAQALATHADSLAYVADTLAHRADSIAQAAMDKANENATKISQVEQDYKDADAQLQTQIDDLTDRVKDLEDDVDDLLDRMGVAEQDIDNLQADLASMITGVVAQGTYNPVIGSTALPLNVRSMILAAFYGEALQETFFPSVNSSMYVYPDEALTDEDKTVLDGSFAGQIKVYNGDKLIQLGGATGNAGTLYLTINPNTVDFDGLTSDETKGIALENSQAVASGITLGKLRKSDEVLNFGYTRAAANGFYEVPATLAKDQIDAVKGRFDINSLKDVARDILNAIKNRSTSDINFTNIYQTLMENADNIWDANAVKAYWTNSANQLQAVYSQYNLLATAIKPLSYNFLKDWDAPQIPTISPITYDVDFTLKAPSFSDVTAPDFTVTAYVVYNTISGNRIVIGIYGTAAEADAAIAANPGATRENHTFTVPEFQEFVDNINTNVVGKARDNIQDLENQIVSQTQSNVNKACSKINDKVISRLNKVINRVNNKIQNINHYLQPTMIYEAADGTWYNMSTNFLAPVHFDGTGYLDLNATSFSAELLAPAYKKFVAVTNVWDASDLSKNAKDGDATCKSVLSNANSGSLLFNKVVEGQVKEFALNVPNAGYIYEISYVAIDYHGKLAAQKSYIRAY